MSDQGTRRGDAARKSDAGTRGRGDAARVEATPEETSGLSLSPRPRVAASPRLVPPASPRPRVSASLLRLFCAVELSAEIRARAAEHIARLRRKLPDVRASWDRTEKLHVTLKFFGEVEESRAPALSLAAERAANRVAPFTLAIADAGAFPPHGPPRVLWLGVRNPSNELAHLQQALEDECAAAGFKREERPFHPHLTIARPRTPKGAGQLAALHKDYGFAPVELSVTQLVVIRSELNREGSRYTTISHHPLGVHV